MTYVPDITVHLALSDRAALFCTVCSDSCSEARPCAHCAAVAEAAPLVEKLPEPGPRPRRSFRTAEVPAEDAPQDLPPGVPMGVDGAGQPLHLVNHPDPVPFPPAEVSAEVAPQAEVRMLADGDTGISGEENG